MPEEGLIVLPQGDLGGSFGEQVVHRAFIGVFEFEDEHLVGKVQHAVAAPFAMEPLRVEPKTNLPFF